MSGAVRIRDAVMPAELSAVRGLFREYAQGLGVDLCFQGFEEELASLPGRYAGPGGGIWLAVMDEEIVGCVALRPLDAATCEMKRLYVRARARGHGVGRLLAERTLAAARSAGFKRICLDTLPTMASAIALYRELGFTPIPPYKHNPVPGAVFMGLDLTGSTPARGAGK